MLLPEFAVTCGDDDDDDGLGFVFYANETNLKDGQ